MSDREVPFLYKLYILVDEEDNKLEMKEQTREFHSDKVHDGEKQKDETKR